MTLEQRVQQLERQNRWVRRAGMAGLALVLVVVLMGQGRPVDPPVVRAQMFELVRADGSVQGQWRTGDDLGTQLAMRIDGSKASVSLGVDSTGMPFLSLYDKDEKLRVSLTHVQSPRLVLSDAAEKPRMDMFVMPTGTPAITLRSADGQTRVILGSHEGETALTLSDANGKVRCKVFAEPNGESGVHIRDASGITVWKASSEKKD